MGDRLTFSDGLVMFSVKLGRFFQCYVELAQDIKRSQGVYALAFAKLESRSSASSEVIVPGLIECLRFPLVPKGFNQPLAVNRRANDPPGIDAVDSDREKAQATDFRFAPGFLSGKSWLLAHALVPGLLRQSRANASKMCKFCV